MRDPDVCVSYFKYVYITSEQQRVALLIMKEPNVLLLSWHLCRWFGGNARRGTRWHSMQSFGGPTHSTITWTGTVLMKDCNIRHRVVVIYSLKWRCTLVRFPTYVTGFSLAETVKLENTKISNYNYVDKGSDCEVRWASKAWHRS